MEIFIFWILFAIVIGWIATTKGRSGIGFFLLSIFISPLLGLIIVLIISSNKEVLLIDEKICPSCKEIIKIDAIKCKHCGNELNNKIIKVDGNKNRLVLNIKDTPYSFEDIKRIVTTSYDKANKPEITLDIINKFIIKGEYGMTYVEIEVFKDTFIICSYNMNIPAELEIKDSIESSSSNTDKLIELGNLYKEGLLTKEEFEEQKRLLLLK